jgi:hypothetical protein
MPRCTELSLPEIEAEFSAIARDTAAVFGHLDARQLNWRSGSDRWSVAQCFDHLLNANREMLDSIDAAFVRPPTVWQRLPGLPRLFGPLLIRSQMPEARRKFTAPKQATPSSSDIDPSIVQRFIDHQGEAARRVHAIDAASAARTMVSPFVSFITYSVLDGCRLIVTHERRHFEQARRVLLHPDFPK